MAYTFSLVLLVVVAYRYNIEANAEVNVAVQASNTNDVVIISGNGQTCTTGDTETTTTTCPSDEKPETGSVDCPSDYCPTSEAQSLTTCSFPTNSCTSSESVCKCGFNQRRTAPGGSCISVYDCPPFDCSCRPNEVYNPCEPYCPTDDCIYAPFNGTCPPALGRIGIVLTCVPKCTCAEGYYRNNGVCIPRDECPNIQDQTSSTTSSTTSTCPPGQILDDCGVDCPTDYCPTSPTSDQIDCSPPFVCPSYVCKCPDGQRKDANGNCIDLENCPCVY